MSFSLQNFAYVKVIKKLKQRFQSRELNSVSDFLEAANDIENLLTPNEIDRIINIIDEIFYIYESFFKKRINDNLEPLLPNCKIDDQQEKVKSRLYDVFKIFYGEFQRNKGNNALKINILKEIRWVKLIFSHQLFLIEYREAYTRYLCDMLDKQIGQYGVWLFGQMFIPAIMDGELSSQLLQKLYLNFRQSIKHDPERFNEDTLYNAMQIYDVFKYQQKHSLFQFILPLLSKLKDKKLNSLSIINYLMLKIMKASDELSPEDKKYLINLVYEHCEICEEFGQKNFNVNQYTSISQIILSQTYSPQDQRKKVDWVLTIFEEMHHVPMITKIAFFEKIFSRCSLDFLSYAHDAMEKIFKNGSNKNLYEYDQNQLKNIILFHCYRATYFMRNYGKVELNNISKFISQIIDKYGKLFEYKNINPFSVLGFLIQGISGMLNLIESKAEQSSIIEDVFTQINEDLDKIFELYEDESGIKLADLILPLLSNIQLLSKEIALKIVEQLFHKYPPEMKKIYAEVYANGESKELFDNKYQPIIYCINLVHERDDCAEANELNEEPQPNLMRRKSY